MAIVPKTADVLSVVSTTFGVRVSVLTSRTRSYEICVARHVAMWLMQMHANMTLPRIGKELGGRHHTTVLHGIRRIEHRQRSDQWFGEMLEQLGQRLFH
jgi:chromosomal replication initiator protein